VITEWTASSPSANVFAGTRRELLRIDYNGTIHGLQDIGFNPYAKAGDEDYGLLYICAGDGGSVAAGRPDWTHKLSSPYGSILRLDPLGTNSVNGRYGIPAANPYANDGKADTLGEIYAWGFRNPHRISWDSQPPHRALIGDIGENQIEEVNLLTKGGDYGYPDREGTFVLRTNQTMSSTRCPPTTPRSGLPTRSLSSTMMRDRPSLAGTSIAGPTFPPSAGSTSLVISPAAGCSTSRPIPSPRAPSRPSTSLA
jgi:glucose/arabinose dehydrogenase